MFFIEWTTWRHLISLGRYSCGVEYSSISLLTCCPFYEEHWYILWHYLVIFDKHLAISLPELHGRCILRNRNCLPFASTSFQPRHTNDDGIFRLIGLFARPYSLFSSVGVSYVLLVDNTHLYLNVVMNSS
jgi:hypothetical protein